MHKNNINNKLHTRRIFKKMQRIPRPTIDSNPQKCMHVFGIKSWKNASFLSSFSSFHLIYTYIANAFHINYTRYPYSYAIQSNFKEDNFFSTLFLCCCWFVVTLYIIFILFEKGSDTEKKLRKIIIFIIYKAWAWTAINNIIEVLLTKRFL